MAESNGILKEALYRARREIAAADSIEDLLQEVARFMSALSFADSASLPEGFLPQRILTQQDISHWDHRLRVREEEDAALRAVSELFACASQRAQHLRPRASDPPAGPARRVQPP